MARSIVVRQENEGQKEILEVDGGFQSDSNCPAPGPGGKAGKRVNPFPGIGLGGYEIIWLISTPSELRDLGGSQEK